MRAALALVLVTGCARILGIHDPVTGPGDDDVHVDAMAMIDAQGTCGCPFGCDTGACESVQFALGIASTCVIDRRQVYCWGKDGNDTVTRRVPVPILGYNDAAAISMSTDNPGMTSSTCVSRTSELDCWGNGSNGQLGDSDESSTTESGALVFQELSGPPVLVANGGYHTCAEISNGNVYCWGDDTFQEWGNGQTSGLPTDCGTSNGACSPMPQLTALGGTQAQLVAGTQFTCALSAGNVSCWGANSLGQLGAGDTGIHSTPAPVLTISTASQIAAGAVHVCAVADGQVRCWGGNDSGQFGMSHPASSAIPMLVPLVGTAIAVAAGARFTCALRDDKTVWCWGSNDIGQLGNGSHGTDNAISQVMNIDDAIAIAAGGSHACAVRENHSIWCWGENQYGALGDDLPHDDECGAAGSRPCSPVPVQVAAFQ
jgi:alpha-tubulin suppressor-like RCC1 family protein